jgi:HAE1 family hydrophobic/amphiphilic exporter-1
MMKVDNDLAKKCIDRKRHEYLSTLVGSNYEISFIKYGINYKVIVQAARISRITRRYFKAVCKKIIVMRWYPFCLYEVRKVYGLSEITRHNMYTSTEISAAAVGYSSGTAIKVVQKWLQPNYHVVMISIGLVYLQMR